MIFVLMIFGAYLIRALNERQVDDLTPGINCERGIIDKSQNLAVIPLFENESIAENKTWCDYILSLNMTLIMHGVYHSYREFDSNVSLNDIEKGRGEFKKCFGYYPPIFQAPQLAISWGNEEKVKSFGMHLRGYPYQITHKVYHCNDTGRFKNRFIDIF